MSRFNILSDAITCDTIDSRDIESRYEELDTELRETYEEHMEIERDLDGEDARLDFEQWVEKVASNEFRAAHELAVEYRAIAAIREEIEGYAGDGMDGTTLVAESYFVEHIREIIEDCYEMPKHTGWPFNHMKMDWEGAANEARSDYTEIEIEGVTFLYR